MSYQSYWSYLCYPSDSLAGDCNAGGETARRHQLPAAIPSATTNNDRIAIGQ